MTEKLKYIDPLTLLKLGNLHLRARYVVEGLISGLHRSPFKGSSLEFAQHREYAPFDDPRYIDWKIFGRTDRFFIKQYEEETNLRAYILLDSSGSMSFKSGKNIDKLTYSINLEASLTYLLLRQDDSVGLAVFDKKINCFIPPRANFEQFSNIANILENLKPGLDTEIYKSINQFSRYLKKRALIIFISDLFDDPEKVMFSIKQLRFKHHDVIVFHILDPVELNLNYEGPVIFESIENRQDTVNTEVQEIKEYYSSLIRSFVQEYKIGFRNSGIDYSLITTDTPIELGLGSFLAFRKE